MLGFVRRIILLSIVLASCFREIEESATESSSSEATFEPLDGVTSASVSSSTATSHGSGSGSTTSGSSTTGGEGATDTSTESSESSSEGSSGSESSSTGDEIDPYGPCWPGEPMGGAHCEAGEHGAICIADDARMTGAACSSECELAGDCPDPLSGSASPVCVDIGDFNICVLDCDVDEDCPDGMQCSVFATGALDPWPAACVWPWGWWE